MVSRTPLQFDRTLLISVRILNARAHSAPQLAMFTFSHQKKTDTHSI